MRLAPNPSAGAPRRFNQVSLRFIFIICLTLLVAVCVFAVVGMASGPRGLPLIAPATNGVDTGNNSDIGAFELQNGDIDTDGEGISDAMDNCPLVSNPGQQDSAGDALGDACDLDDDNDGVEDTADLCPGTPAGAPINEQGGPLLVVNSIDDDPASGSTSDGACTTGQTVTVGGDSVPECTLRAAIQEANGTAGPQTIDFEPEVFASSGPYVIQLTGALPDLSTDMTINGRGASLITVRGGGSGNSSRIFTVTASVTVNILGLTVTNGQAPFGAVGGGNINGEHGGGIRNDGTLTLTGVAISGNRAGNGGGIPNFGGNGGNGGGIYNAGVLTVTNSTISGNEFGSGGNATAIPFTSGQNGSGGGINNLGTLTISNSTISSNITPSVAAGGGGFGGGINNTGPLTVSNSTITANLANSGGISNSGGGSITLRSTIVAGNSASVSPDIDGPVQSDGFNLIGDTTGATINPNPGAGPDITGVSPNLGPLANNGGPTQTHAFAANSPAIDKGNSFGLTTDQRGETRLVDSPAIANAGDGADIGSFETSTLPTVSSGEVTGRILDANGAPVEGVVVQLSGTQNRKFISDANGFYRFENVATNGFYTVTPTRANYGFNPAQRSFSLLGNKTEALFTGVFHGDAANPLDTTEYFVRQQYLDVLGREPDEGGFNYWNDQINQCSQLPAVSSQSSVVTNQADCLSARRIDVAAAFFISREFHLSGAYIYNVYGGGLGRRPWFREYAVDRKQVVGGPELAAERAAFAASFVERAEFVTMYEAYTTAETFVAALLANVHQTAAVDLSSEGEQLLARYQTGATQNESRSLVLRGVADNAAFQRSQYNQAFVLTEYFSYLRRDADAAGFEFWLNVLQSLDGQTPGNYRGMVCAFITAAEYQHRVSGVVSHSNAECASQEKRVASNKR